MHGWSTAAASRPSRRRSSNAARTIRAAPCVSPSSAPARPRRCSTASFARALRPAAGCSAAARSLFHLGTTADINGLPSSPYYAQAYDGMSRYVKRLVDAGKKVVLVVDHPTLPDPKLCLKDARVTWHGRIGNFLAIGHADPRCEISLDRHHELATQYRKLLEEVRKVAPDRIYLFDQEPYLCDMAKRRCGAYDGDVLQYSFADHVSDAASTRIGAALNEFLANGFVQNRGRD